MEVRDALMQYGLTENEAKVYLACLSLGRAKGQEIAKQSGVPRTTTYTCLEMLIQKHLVQVLEDRKVREYIPADPSKIVDRSEAAATALKRALPEMLGLLHGASKQYKIRYYDGLSEVKNMYEGILQMRGLKEYLIIGSESSWLQLDTKWFKEFMKKRAEKNIQTRLILEESEEARAHQKQSRATNSEVKVMENYFPERSHSGVYIFPNKVMFLDFGKKAPFATEIESKELANMQRMLFETIWKFLA